MGVMAAQIHHETIAQAANRHSCPFTSGAVGKNSIATAPISSPGTVHHARETSANRIRFTPRIYCAGVLAAASGERVEPAMWPIAARCREPRERTRPKHYVGSMIRKHMLVGSSLLSVLLLSFHFTQDAQHARGGTFAAGPANLVAILILMVFLIGPALLAERRSGQLIMALVALSAMAMPAMHFASGADFRTYSGAFFFIWCLIALGVTGSFSLLLLLASELPRVWQTTRRP